MTTPLAPLAWLGDPAVKAGAVERMREHRELDGFIQRTYVHLLAPGSTLGYRGCFHGCLTTEALAAEAGKSVRQWLQDGGDDNAAWHHAGERLWGIPQPLGAVLDSLFENLPLAYAGEFALAVTEAIPVGADLSLIVARLMLDLLDHEDQGVVRHTVEGSGRRAAVEAVAALYRRTLAGETVTGDEWETARRAAYAADADAAYAAANADAAAAAYAYADAADEARRDEYYRWLGNRLIEHLAAAPVPSGVSGG